ncbi:MAG: hypothetical protein IKT43_02375 [Clostridia bacterium]|nr:hypothetical protein [Clostridia bacterium]
MFQALRRVFCLLLALSTLFMASCSMRVLSSLNILPAPEEDEEEEYTPSEEFFGLGVHEPEGFVFSGRIFIVGDSTACSTYSSTRVEAQDLMGWGKYLNYYFLPEDQDRDGAQGVSVYNYAVSGASSLSYTTSDGYSYLKEYLSRGDYLFIQFGHNDENPAAAISAKLGMDEVSAEGKNENGLYSFEWILNEYYVQYARSVGAVPVLLSPIARLDSESGKASVESHLPYRDAMQRFASEENIAFFDMTALTEEFYNGLVSEQGREATLHLHAYSAADRKTIDVTHLSRYGAFRVAGLVADAVLKCPVALSNFVMEPQEEVLPREKN